MVALDEAGRGVGGGVMSGMGRVQPSLLQISTMMESHSPCTRRSTKLSMRLLCRCDEWLIDTWRK